jgi:hypothetical protein
MLARTAYASGDAAIVALHSAGEGTGMTPLSTGHMHEVPPPVGIGAVTFDRRGEGEPTRGAPLARGHHLDERRAWSAHRTGHGAVLSRTGPAGSFW